jgi:hypothetical protein
VAAAEEVSISSPEIPKATSSRHRRTIMRHPSLESKRGRKSLAPPKARV